jgi:hypothetical protein
MKYRLLCMAVCASWILGCDGETTQSDDGGQDPDLTEDVQPDQQDVDAQDIPAEDVVTDDTTPVSCAGSETLTLQFSDYEGNPVSGIPVALKCGTDVFDTTSDAGGLASFGSLDLSNTMDVTYIYDRMARSILGLAGTRTVPDPLPLTVGEPPEETVMIMRGGVTHNQTDSIVIVTSDVDADITRVDRYELRSTLGTGHPMSVLEYTTTGTTATPVGYSLMTYDFTAEGSPGPDVSAAAATFETKTVMLDFDLRSDSPLRNRLLASDEEVYPNRLIAGIRIWSADAEDRAWLAGLTTNWNKGDTQDTLEVAWMQSALDAADSVYPSALILDPNYMYYISLSLPDDPGSWPSSFTVHDTPQIPGLSPTTPIPFDHAITVDHPGWARTIGFHIRLSSGSGVLGNADFVWSVVTHPETGSFSFASLPWPSGVPYSDVIPNLTLFVGVTGVAYDADPYDGYILWTDEEWYSQHFQSYGVDSRFLIEGP